MILELIYKYLDNQASEKEVEIIFNWIETSEENKAKFIELKKTWLLTQTNSGLPLDQNNFQDVKNEIKSIEKKKRFNYLKYAAVLIIFLGITFIIKTISTNNNTITNSIVIENENGNINLIQTDQNKTIVNENGEIIGQQNANEIVYTPNNTKKALAYNTIKVPYGKTFKLTLSDGTIVHLNAGTKFKYPTQFNLNNPRQVFLTGEAFFKVTKDAKRPFKVNTQSVNVNVLGTTFNLSAYPDDLTTHCELVEGSVKLTQSNNPKNSTLLKPNEKSSFSLNNNKFTTTATDISPYIAWVYGDLVFKNQTFKDLTIKLERAYGVKIINKNKQLAIEKFSGTINFKTSSVEDFLNLLKYDTPFNFYRKNNTTIEITN
ncbi:FecR family protein [Tamlana sp. 62-3]|uniref:FecR family protein n=1 Tax=Neotamlana sargassicola TaxID=2883125 RepID=A0A9X1I5B3_9FLAO|nr:FecR family protein [Tamlana sargassicola]MCB4807598.1 FecR family protein [Tamlana sargassicola]